MTKQRSFFQSVLSASVCCLMLAGILILCLSGCSDPKPKCDICEKAAAKHDIEAVTVWHLCDDCYSNVLLAAMADGADDANYYDYDGDYGYGGHHQNGFGSGHSGRCNDCGRSIDADRYYCDKCLGYGTCQDCGKSIDDDRLYCDRCLGYGTCQDCGRSIDDDRLYCDSCLY